MLLCVALLPQRLALVSRWLGLAAVSGQMLILLAMVLPVLLGSGVGLKEFHLVERLAWIQLPLGSFGRLDIDYFVGMDGASFVLTLLSLIVLWVATVASWGIKQNPKAYFMLLLLLNTSVIGVFAAMDFFLFFLFYEFMLLPMFFLIGVWGGERREYAAIKFFIYTLVGSVFMLLVMVGLALSFTDAEASHQAGIAIHTLAFTDLMPVGVELVNAIPNSIFDYNQTLFGFDARLLAFVVLFIGFAIKIPMVPLHTWLPDAHVEAPTPISVVLAGILLKVGGYGIWRICMGIFPDGMLVFAWWMGLLGIISIIYGALVAMGQTDFKRMIAYSSVSHMGYVLLGFASLTEIGTDGAMYQMFTHGIVSAMLFLLVGVLYDRVHDRDMRNFSGLWQQMPRYSVFVLIAFFASLGLPGLCSFVSEIMVLMGSFQSQSVSRALPQWMAAIAVVGILLSAVYYLRAFRQMFFGKFAPEGSRDWASRLTDLTLREYITLIPLALLTVLLGILPMLVLRFL